MGTLNTRDKKLEEKKTIEQRISYLARRNESNGGASSRRWKKKNRTTILLCNLFLPSPGPFL